MPSTLYCEKKKKKRVRSCFIQMLNVADRERILFGGRRDSGNIGAAGQRGCLRLGSVPTAAKLFLEPAFLFGRFCGGSGSPGVLVGLITDSQVSFGGSTSLSFPVLQLEATLMVAGIAVLALALSAAAGTGTAAAAEPYAHHQQHQHCRPSNHPHGPSRQNALCPPPRVVRAVVWRS